MVKKESYLRLLEESFPGIKDNIIRCQKLGFHWESEKLFIKKENGQALSHVALLKSRILIEEKWHDVAALHAICTKQSHRGLGLASGLILEALQ